MFEPSITISLLPNLPRAPFVLGPDLEPALAQAAEMGYGAVELFAPDVEAIDVAQIQQGCQRHGLRVSTLGTGGGWVTKQWSLLDPDPQIRAHARQYIREVIQRAAQCDATAIIGSMQGRCGGRPRTECLDLLREQLNELAMVAAELGRPLFYEPLNRYETDVFNSIVETADFLNEGLPANLKILADLFHMNIEEQDLAEAIRRAGSRIGHVHFVDSNRQAPGLGHTDFAPIWTALHSIHYAGYLAIEALPLPDPATAAKTALATFRRLQTSVQ
jgi:sugar phosphate isomerase/epimerase